MSHTINQGIVLGMKQIGFEFIKYDENNNVVYFTNYQNQSNEVIDRAKIIFEKMYGLKIVVEGDKQ